MITDMLRQFYFTVWAVRKEGISEVVETADHCGRSTGTITVSLVLAAVPQQEYEIDSS